MGHKAGVAKIFLGGRNDNFANFSGKIAEAAHYDRALDAEENSSHSG